MSRFLITGLPRIRSAWLATLLNAAGVETVHDYTAAFGSLSALAAWLRQPGLRGWCDPCAACLHPEFSALEFSGRRVVIVERDPGAACMSMARWAGKPMPFETARANLATFRGLVDAEVLTVPYASLDDYAAVDSIVRHCTGHVLSPQLWRTFDLLKIEQHMPKARARLEARQ